MLEEINGEGAVTKNQYGYSGQLILDYGIIAVGFRYRASLLNVLSRAEKDVYEIAAGNGIGSIAPQIGDAYEIAWGIWQNTPPPLHRERPDRATGFPPAALSG